MSDDVQCPYCNKWCEINHDDGYGYEEETAHWQECDHCDKSFKYYTMISYFYEALEAPCLNDDSSDEHVWQAIGHAWSEDVWGKLVFTDKKWRCELCDKTTTENPKEPVRRVDNDNNNRGN